MIEDRLQVAKMYVHLTRAFKEVAYPRGVDIAGTDLETLMVLLCVFIGDAEGRPMTASNVVHYSGLARATVYRRLDTLLSMKKIVRTKNQYHYGEDVMNPDKYRELPKIIDKLHL